MGRVIGVLAIAAVALSCFFSARAHGALSSGSIDSLCAEKGLSLRQCEAMKSEISSGNYSLSGPGAAAGSAEAHLEDGGVGEGDGRPEEGAAGAKEDAPRVSVDTKQGAKGMGTAGQADSPGRAERKRTLFDRYVEGYSPIEFTKGLQPFGYNVFANATVKNYSSGMPPAGDYLIGPGDDVDIFMWGRVSGRHLLTVSRDGDIFIPDVGPFTVAGLTFDEMKGLLKKKVGDIIGTEINVTMGRLRTIQVFVLGEVKNPGPYNVTAMSTITDAVIASGGPSDIGTLRNVTLKRGGRDIAVMDFYDLFLGGDKSKDMRLRDGDVVFVPTVGPLVGVIGNVRRPAVYEIKESTGLADILSLAGGVIPTAYTQHMQVERVEGNSERIVVDINAEDGELENYALQDADIVKVFSIYDRDMNAVFVEGNVKRPGKVELKEKMMLSDVIRGPDDLLDESFLDYGLIKRFVRPGGEMKVVPFNLGGLLEGEADEDIELRPKDTIHIFSSWLFRDRPRAYIEGEVRTQTAAGLSALPAGVDIAALQAARVSFDPDRGLLSFRGIMKSSEREALLALVEAAGLRPDAPQDGPRRTRAAEYRDAVNRLYADSNAKGEVVIEKEMRVKDLVLAAGGLTKEASHGEGELYRTDRRTNRVTLVRFDLGKAMQGGAADNILLQDLDRVVIHSVFETGPNRFVSVKGEVTRPGQYQYASNMRVSDLVFTAGSALESAYLEEAELVSRNGADEPSAITVRRVDIAKAMANDPSHDLPLAPGDTLFIKKIPDWGAESLVTLSGEVRFPGRYIIKRGERLSDVIERAGGFTERAYLKGAVFSRESVRKLQQSNLDDSIDRLERSMLSEAAAAAETSVSLEAAQQAKAAMEQRRQLIEKMRRTKTLGRVVVKLAPAGEMRGSPYDVLLEDGDTLEVPWRYSVLNVAGAVVNPASFIYDPGVKVSEYIKKSGGSTEYADMDKAYVVKVDGSALSAENLKRWRLVDWNEQTRSWDFGAAYSALDPGDTIVVPEKTDRIAWLREVKDLTQILYQIAVTAGVIIVAF